MVPHSVYTITVTTLIYLALATCASALQSLLISCRGPLNDLAATIRCFVLQLCVMVMCSIQVRITASNTLYNLYFHYTALSSRSSSFLDRLNQNSPHPRHIKQWYSSFRNHNVLKSSQQDPWWWWLQHLHQERSWLALCTALSRPRHRWRVSYIIKNHIKMSVKLQACVMVALALVLPGERSRRMWHRVQAAFPSHTVSFHVYKFNVIQPNSRCHRSEVQRPPGQQPAPQRRFDRGLLLPWARRQAVSRW